MPVVPPNGLVVVTGASGFIGSHVVISALQLGLRVRGTVRSLDKVQQLPATIAKQEVDVSKLEVVLLDDLTSEAQYEKVLKGVDAVVHVALPGSLPSSPEGRISAAVESNLALLRAAAKEPSIKRVVLTSSSVASTMHPEELDHPVTGDDWNDFGMKLYEQMPDEQKSTQTGQAMTYIAAKYSSEKAAWKFIDEQKPSFDLVSILPNANFGPLLYGEPRSTPAWITGFLGGNDQVLVWPPQWYIDVRDCAKLHVLSLLNESVGGKRFWAAAAATSWNEILGILRKNFPGTKVPEDIPGGDTPAKQQVDNSIATSLLGASGWISLEKSLVDTGTSCGFEVDRKSAV